MDSVDNRPAYYHHLCVDLVNKMRYTYIIKGGRYWPGKLDFMKELEKIAAEILRIETLETRNMDELDFHEVSVWGIKAALEAAYEAGRKSK